MVDASVCKCVFQDETGWWLILKDEYAYKDGREIITAKTKDELIDALQEVYRREQNDGEKKV